MSRRKLSAPQGRWSRCGSFDDRRINARCMVPEKLADAISKVLKSEIFPRLGRQLRSLCIDILACHDETIRAITVIRLNLNLPFKNPRSATAWCDGTAQKCPRNSYPCIYGCRVTDFKTNF